MCFDSAKVSLIHSYKVLADEQFWKHRTSKGIVPRFERQMLLDDNHEVL